MAEVGGIDKQRVDSIVDRLVRLAEQKAENSEAEREILLEAKSSGLNPVAIKKIVREKTETPKQKAKRIQNEEDTDILRHALGLLIYTPLGGAALRRVA